MFNPEKPPIIKAEEEPKAETAPEVKEEEKKTAEEESLKESQEHQKETKTAEEQETEKPSKEPNLSEYGQEALADFQFILEAKRIPEEERQEYVSRLLSKINRDTDEDMIDLVSANLLLDATKRAKELKAGTSGTLSESEKESTEKASEKGITEETKPAEEESLKKSQEQQKEKELQKLIELREKIIDLREKVEKFNRPPQESKTYWDKIWKEQKEIWEEKKEKTQKQEEVTAKIEETVPETKTAEEELFKKSEEHQKELQEVIEQYGKIISSQNETMKKGLKEEEIARLLGKRIEIMAKLQKLSSEEYNRITKESKAYWANIYEKEKQEEVTAKEGETVTETKPPAEESLKKSSEQQKEKELRKLRLSELYEKIINLRGVDLRGKVEKFNRPPKESKKIPEELKKEFETMRSERGEKLSESEEVERIRNYYLGKLGWSVKYKYTGFFRRKLEVILLDQEGKPILDKDGKEKRFKTISKSELNWKETPMIDFLKQELEKREAAK